MRFIVFDMQAHLGLEALGFFFFFFFFLCVQPYQFQAVAVGSSLPPEALVWEQALCCGLVVEVGWHGRLSWFPEERLGPPARWAHSFLGSCHPGLHWAAGFSACFLDYG